MTDARQLVPAPRQLKWLRAGAVVGVIALLAFSVPVVWMAVAGGLGLLAIAALLALTGAALRVLPYLGQTLENRLLRARLREARENPIEQMQRHFVQRAQQIQSFRNGLIAIHTQIESMREMLSTRRSSDPHHDLRKQEKALATMSRFYACNAARLEAAQTALAEYKAHIATRLFEWNFAQAGKQILENLSATDQQNILRDMLCDEASRSVQAHFNQVFAQLDLDGTTLRASLELDFDERAIPKPKPSQLPE